MSEIREKISIALRDNTSSRETNNKVQQHLSKNQDNILNLQRFNSFLIALEEVPLKFSFAGCAK